MDSILQRQRIASRLNDLSEQYLLDHIDQVEYAFGVHDLLGEVPTNACTL